MEDAQTILSMTVRQPDNFQGKGSSICHDDPRVFHHDKRSRVDGKSSSRELIQQWNAVGQQFDSLVEETTKSLHRFYGVLSDHLVLFERRTEDHRRSVVHATEGCQGLFKSVAKPGHVPLSGVRHHSVQSPARPRSDERKRYWEGSDDNLYSNTTTTNTITTGQHESQGDPKRRKVPCSYREVQGGHPPPQNTSPYEAAEGGSAQTTEPDMDFGGGGGGDWFDEDYPSGNTRQSEEEQLPPRDKRSKQPSARKSDKKTKSDASKALLASQGVTTLDVKDIRRTIFQSPDQGIVILVRPPLPPANRTDAGVATTDMSLSASNSSSSSSTITTATTTTTQPTKKKACPKRPARPLRIKVNGLAVPHHTMSECQLDIFRKYESLAEDMLRQMEASENRWAGIFVFSEGGETESTIDRSNLPRIWKKTVHSFAMLWAYSSSLPEIQGDDRLRDTLNKAKALLGCLQIEIQRLCQHPTAGGYPKMNLGLAEDYEIACLHLWKDLTIENAGLPPTTQWRLPLAFHQVPTDEIAAFMDGINHHGTEGNFLLTSKEMFLQSDFDLLYQIFIPRIPCSTLAGPVSGIWFDYLQII